MAFHGMAAVVVDVVDIVETIDARGGETERHKDDDTPHEAVTLEDGATEEGGQEHEGVLNPLLRPDEFHEGGRRPRLFYILHKRSSCLLISVTIFINIHANGSVMAVQTRNVGQ